MKENENQILGDDLNRIHDQIVGSESEENDSSDTMIRGAREALDLIKRVRAQEMCDTPNDVETVTDLTKKTAAHSDQRIGRFEIKRKLGQGGFGVVYLAADPDLMRDVAVKVPRLDAANAPELMERFLKEGRAAAALTHPNIVPVFETGSVGTICYTASEYISGCTLAAYSQAHDVTPKQSAGIVVRLAEAMEHAHQRGVLHRDIKPSNVLVHDNENRTLEDRVRLTDFGLAKNLDEDSRQTKTGALVGTPAYMSPEQIGDVEKVGPASDIYSLGAVLYELLVGQPPFVGNTVIETLDQVRRKEAIAPSKHRIGNSRAAVGITPDLDAICLKCLEKSPASRYQSCFDLAEDLSRFIRNEPVTARRIGPWIRCSRWYARNKVVATAVTLTFLSLVLGLAGTLWMYSQSQSNLAVANQQTELANRGLDRTKRSIDRMLTDVSQALANQPRMDGLRTRLLNEARELYQEVLDDDYVQQVEISKALDSFFRLASIHRQSGNAQQAQKIAQQGLVAYEKYSMEDRQEIDVIVSWSRLVRMDYEVQIATGQPARESIHAVIKKLENIQTTDVDPLESLAEAFRQLGIDHLNKGKTVDAIKDLELAVEVLDRIEGDDHLDSIQFLRAQTLNSLAIARKSAGDLVAATNDYRQVVDIMTELVGRFPERVRYQEMQAIVSLNLGNLYFNHQKFEASELAYRNSMDASAVLVTLFPDRQVFWNVCSGAASGVALTLYKQEKFKASETAYLHAIKVGEQFREKFSANQNNSESLARTFGGMTNLMIAQQRFDDAKSYASVSVKLKREQVQQFPTRLHLKKSLSLGIGNLARVEFNAGRKIESLARFQEALDIALELYESNPKFPGQMSNINYQQKGIAGVLASLDRREAAIDAVDRVADFLPANAGQIQYAVSILGSIVGGVQDSDEFDSEAKQELVEFYSEHARSLLQRAQDLGADSSQWLDEEPANALKVD